MIIHHNNDNTVTIDYDDGAHYEGGYLYGRPHGQGHMKYVLSYPTPLSVAIPK